MIARVAVEHRNSYVLRSEDGSEIFATLAGKLRYETKHREDLPAVGDFVAVRDTVIEEVLPRARPCSCVKPWATRSKAR